MILPSHLNHCGCNLDRPIRFVKVQTPTKRKDITPVAQEPDFLENEDEPEVTLPEGYEESDFDDRKKAEQSDEARC